MIPYGKQSIDESDIEAVIEVLRSDWLTTGPKVAEFEEAFARFTGVGNAVAVSSGTAALHAAMHVLGIGPGDEVIVPAMTFAASANCVVYEGGTPVFADVDPGTLLLDPASVESRITPRTKAIVAVDFAGQPCDYEALRKLARPRGLALVGDACHALGATDRGVPVGSIADLTAFSLHPVKHITTGEGGIVTTDDPEAATRMRMFRNHGITADHRAREAQGSWFYEIADLGYNYRLTDFQCALGISQLARLPRWIARRREIAERYGAAFADHVAIQPLRVREGAFHSYHLYVVRLRPGNPGGGRDTVFRKLRDAGIGVNVHYIPVHLHPFYRRRFGTTEGMCLVAESAYREILSLPVYQRMSDEDIEAVIRAVREATEAGGRRA
jgi:perosamine synthetase